MDCPWGSWEVLDEGEGFKVKKIIVKPNCRLSLQSHQHRSERWIVAKGQAEVQCGEDRIILEVGQMVTIPTETCHRLRNPGSQDLIIIEVQLGKYLEEDDIKRYEDDYGRVECAYTNLHSR